MNDLERSARSLREKILSLSSTTITKSTLVYFDIIGIAWPMRVMLHLSDIDYELIQISVLEWGQKDTDGDQILKPCFMNGHLPLYLDSDIELNQSALINEYLADKYGFLAKKHSERMNAREVMAQAYDALFHWNGLFSIISRLGVSDQEANKRMEAFMGNGVYGSSANGYRHNLDAFERYLVKSDGNYFVGNSLSVADLQSFNVLRNWYKAFAPDVFRAEYPRLDEFVLRIESMPKISSYIENHQEPTVWFKWPDAALKLTSEAELNAIKE